MRKYVLHKRLTPLVVVSVICFLFICPLIQPAAAADLNYEDYILSADITDDGKIVTVSLPIQGTRFVLYNGDMLKIDQVDGTSISFAADAFDNINYVMYNLQISPSATNYLMLSNVPRDTEFNYVITFRGPIVPVDGIVPGSMVIADPISYAWFYNSEHQRIKQEQLMGIQTEIVDTTGQNRVWRYESDFVLADLFPDDTGPYLTSASYFRPSFSFRDVQFATSDIYTVSLLSYTLNLNIRSLVSDDSYSDLLGSINNLLADQGVKIDKLTGEVKQTNEKLDDLYTGGAAGEALDEKDDVLTNAGDSVNTGLSNIDSFKDSYMDLASDNIHLLTSSIDLTFLAAPLKFVQTYTNKIVSAIPSPYMVVFTLPILLGVIMYIFNRVPRIPEPDHSGDEVTRQMTTTTRVIKGRNAGSVTVTETTTTSREIGRSSQSE